jgi:hypothetical protein
MAHIQNTAIRYNLPQIAMELSCEINRIKWRNYSLIRMGGRRLY